MRLLSAIGAGFLGSLVISLLTALFVTFLDLVNINHGPGGLFLYLKPFAVGFMATFSFLVIGSVGFQTGDKKTKPIHIF